MFSTSANDAVFITFRKKVRKYAGIVVYLHCIYSFGLFVYSMLGFLKKYLSRCALVFVAALAFLSCTNERQEVVRQAVRIISEATAEMQDVDNLELNQLKSAPESLQTSLFILQNRHPGVRLSDEDTKTIEMEMAKFSQAQENAITVFQRRIDDLEESIIKLTNNDDSDDDNEA